MFQNGKLNSHISFRDHFQFANSAVSCLPYLHAIPVRMQTAAAMARIFSESSKNNSLFILTL